MKAALSVARLRAPIAIIAGITLAGIALATAQSDGAVAGGRTESAARKLLLRSDSHGWHARWSGAMDRVSSNRGYFGADALIGASSRWGATATSLPLAGGLMRRDEVRSFRIKHALALSVGSAKQDVWSWPAQRSDGENVQPNAIPEGARFMLDPELDLSKLDMPR